MEDCWFVEVGGVKNDFFTRNIFVDTEEVESKRREFNNKDFYCSIYSYKESVDKGPLKAPFYLDIDNHEALINENAFKEVKRDTILAINTLQSVYGVPIEYMQIYFSGSKGFHVIVPQDIFDIEEDERLNDIYYLIATEIKKHTLFGNIDLKYDRRRLFRVPNSINNKSGLYKIPLSYEELITSTMNSMTDLASNMREIENNITPKIIHKAKEKFEELRDIVYKPRDKKKYSLNTRFKKMLPCTLNVLDDGCGRGNRNNVTVAVSSALLQNGISFDEVEDRILTWNEEKNDPPLPEREVRRAVLSAYQGLQRGMRFGCTKMKEYGYCVPGKCGRVK